MYKYHFQVSNPSHTEVSLHGIDTRSSTPRADVEWRLPANSWDTHVHVFDPQGYPYDPERQYTPMAASYDELLEFSGNFSFTRTPQNIVFVQPSPYGTDNSLILDLLRNYSASPAEGLLRAIAVIDPASVTDEELQEMDALGVRGVRVNTQGATSSTGFSELSTALRETGDRVSGFKHWALQVYTSGESWDRE